MKHKSIEILIQKALDREITEQERRHLNTHLAKCSSCQKLYEELIRSEQVHDLIEYYPRHNFNERVLKTLGFRKIFAWTRTVKVFAGAWLGSILFLAFSPLPGKLMNQILTSAPALARIINKTEIIISSLCHVILPFIKNSFDPTWPMIGAALSFIVTYLMYKAIKPARKLRKADYPVG